MFILNSAVYKLAIQSVVITLIAITLIQLMLSYKTLHIIFLKEDILKKSTTNTTNAFLKDQNTWLVGNNQDKLLFIVIDSLGHYLAKPNLSILSQIYEKEPNNTIYLKANTDSLTVTGPRLLTLMTGTNPSVIDLIQNVEHSQETKIDNIPAKMKAANKTTFFVGDNTWTKLFPQTFTNYDDNDSFNIFQDNFSDQIIFEEIMDQLNITQNEETRVDMIIAHFLGIDHIFHSTRDVYDDQTKQKYAQYNKFIEKIKDELVDRTIVICSDHGATPKGTHGDSSQEETETFFFVYRKKGFAKNQSITQQIMANIPNYPINSNISAEQCNQPDQRQECGQFEGMLQLDVAINLSNILGLSIPYSSLGMYWPIFDNQYKEGDAEEERKFKDAVARNTYTAIKQQIQNIMENEVYKNKIGDKVLFNLLSEEKIIDQLFEEFQKDDTVQKLKLLFEKCFDLNMQIKQGLKYNSSQEIQQEMIDMAFLEKAMLILIFLIAIWINEQLENEVINIKETDKQYLLVSAQRQPSKAKSKLLLAIFLIIVALVCCKLLLIKQYFIADCLIYACAALVLISIILLNSIKKMFLRYIIRMDILIFAYQIYQNFYLKGNQSLYIMRQDADLFKIMVSILILYSITNFLKGFKYNIALIAIILLSQYSMASPSTYSSPSNIYFPQDYFQFKTLKSILNSTIISIMLPAALGILLLNYLLFSQFPFTNKIHFQRYKFLFQIQYFLSFIFISVTNLIPEISSSSLILVYLPRIQLILFCYQTYFLFRKLVCRSQPVLRENNNLNDIELTCQGTILLFLLNFISLNFIFIGQKSFYVTLLFFSFLFLYRKYLNIIGKRHSFLQVLDLFLLSFYFFFVTDHKYSFGDLQIKAGYIGMGDYVEIYALTFITINSITWQLYTLAIYPVFAKAGYVNSISEIIFKNNLSQQNSNQQIKNEDSSIKKQSNNYRLATVLGYIYFYFLFSLKFFKILDLFSFSLGNDQTHKLLPFLIGDTLFQNTAIPIIVFSIALIKKSKNQKTNDVPNNQLIIDK
ncbi:hypothetical protein ABPG74_005930 [Tetrahymena malaccensis]